MAGRVGRLVRAFPCSLQALMRAAPALPSWAGGRALLHPLRTPIIIIANYCPPVNRKDPHFSLPPAKMHECRYLQDNSLVESIPSELGKLTISCRPCARSALLASGPNARRRLPGRGRAASSPAN